MRRSQIEAAWRGNAECRNCGIRDLVLFADLNEPDFNLIHLPIDEILYEAGAVLYEAGEPGKALFTVRSGLVKLVQSLPDGTQRIVRLLRRGATAGLETLVGSTYQHTAIALAPVLACRIPKEVVEKLSRETPRLHGPLMRRWHEALQQADEWLTELSTGSARVRMARLLLHLLDSGSGEHCRLFGREDLGAMLGITTETASRTIAEFKRGGILVDSGPNQVRCDRARLEAMLEG